MNATLQTAENPVLLKGTALQAAENPVLLKGTASAVPHVLCCKGALAPEVRFLFQKDRPAA